MAELTGYGDTIQRLLEDVIVKAAEGRELSRELSESIVQLQALGERSESNPLAWSNAVLRFTAAAARLQPAIISAFNDIQQTAQEAERIRKANSPRSQAAYKRWARERGENSNE